MSFRSGAETPAEWTPISGGNGGPLRAVVDSRDATPDLVIARNAGGGLITLLLFHYSGKTFNRRACEILTSKTGDFPSSWWDPSLVNIEPCAQH